MDRVSFGSAFVGWPHLTMQIVPLEKKEKNQMTDPRRLCDAYFQALIPRSDEPDSVRTALANISLPPEPGNGFWERVAEQFDKWKPEEDES